MIFQQHQLIGRVSVLGNVLMGRLGYHTALRTLLAWRGISALGTQRYVQIFTAGGLNSMGSA
jgi:ABC-type phosphate/phosphonate transport system ATPase subunit